ncbi:GPI-anchored surface protein, putative [Bodo saltans]|uniref:GPI-anchored surface protein, putative n=1 Tax=Bodo saltans TaxID=75058 RepID=A0A0S4JG12_BODSA|nr:GPI-anchored surface protein, putative [Bodo saltans]|eukprot:CUG90424.1 GPI-anchored surface protein, putative [Bodo saltans]
MSGSASFTLQSGFGDGALSQDAEMPVLLQSYYVVLSDTFGLEASGYAQINASSVSVDWSALDALLPRQLLLVSPSLVAQIQRSDPGWLSRGLQPSTTSTSSSSVASNSIENYLAAKTALLNRTFVFLRVYRSSVWSSAMSSGVAKPCGVPFLASTRLRYDLSSSGDSVVHQATLVVTLSTSDYVTLVALQCSHVPLSLTFDYALVNEGDVEVSSSQIPYVNLHIFQLGVYAAALLLWASHMLYTWHGGTNHTTAPAAAQQSSTSPLPPLRTHQDWLLGGSRPDWLVAVLLSVKSVENIVEIGNRTIQFREIAPGDDENSTRLDHAGDVLHVAGNALVLISMMCVGSGWVFSRVSVDFRRFMSQMGTFVVIYLAFAIFGITKYRNSFGGSIDFIIVVVYFTGVLLSVVQLRTCIEDLRVLIAGSTNSGRSSANAANATTTTSHDPEDTVLFLRMQCLRFPFALNVALVVAAWLLQGFALNAEENEYLSDAVGEFQSIVWSVMAIIFVRREPVIY